MHLELPSPRWMRIQERVLSSHPLRPQRKEAVYSRVLAISIHTLCTVEVTGRILLVVCLQDLPYPVLRQGFVVFVEVDHWVVLPQASSRLVPRRSVFYVCVCVREIERERERRTEAQKAISSIPPIDSTTRSSTAGTCL